LNTLKRCTRCQLPQTYPGITFDAQGVCNLCRTVRQDTPYLGLEALREKTAHILAGKASRRYDAAVAFSGGRDSTYLLHFAKEVLGLNVLAVSLYHRFMPEETSRTIREICATLGVDLHIIPNPALDECSTRCVKAWARKPEAASLVTFCTGCRYGIKRLIPEYCRQEGIPLLLVGNTRMEQMSYRQDLMSVNRRKPSTVNKAIGYLHTLARNPGLLGSPKCACVQAYEFGYPLARKLIRNRQVTVLAPFRDYVFVPDKERTALLSQLNWQHNPRFQAEWRADCYVNLLRQYFYQKLLGFNDLDVQYAELLRTGDITLPQALSRLSADKCSDDAAIAEILLKTTACSSGTCWIGCLPNADNRSADFPSCESAAIKTGQPLHGSPSGPFSYATGFTAPPEAALPAFPGSASQRRCR